MQLFDSLKPNRAPRGVSAIEYGARLNRVSAVEYQTMVIQRVLQSKYGQATANTTVSQPEQVTYQAPVVEATAAVTNPVAAVEAEQLGEEAVVHTDQHDRVSVAQQAVNDALGVSSQAAELTTGTVINLNQEGDTHEYQLPA